MKILQVCPRYYPYLGGIETHVQEISERLVKKGCEVEIVTTDPSGSLQKEEEVNEVLVRRFRAFAPNDLYYFSSQLLLFLRKANSDIIHAHGYNAFPMFACAIVRKAQRAHANKMCSTPHYFGMGRSRVIAFAHVPYFACGMWMLRSAERVVCLSRTEREILIERFLVNPDKAIYIPNGVDYNEFAKSSPTRDTPGFTILYVGRLSPEKNIRVLISAYKEIEDCIPDSKLTIVGDGAEKEELQEFSRNLAIKRVSWVGKVPHQNIGACFKSASVFVLPSRREASPISILEAQAAGTPVIVSDAINRMRIMERGLGLVFKNGNEKDLAQKILKIYREKSLRASFVSRGKKHAKKLDWDKIVDKYVIMYHSILGY
jgi:glycosyltransferase involved in cell wall biosynthesis